MTREFTPTIFSTEQLLDAHGNAEAQIRYSLGSQAAEHYDPNSHTIDRPNYGRLLLEAYPDEAEEYIKSGGIVMEGPEDMRELAHQRWANVRAAIGILSSDRRVIWAPGTIGPNGTAIYLSNQLIHDPNTHGPFEPKVHDDLDKQYLTAVGNASHTGSAAAPNAAEPQHLMVVASHITPASAHTAVHNFAAMPGNFGTNISATGIYDVSIKDGKDWEVRPKTIWLQEAYKVSIRPEFQIYDRTAFGLDISPQEAAVAGLMAAAQTRGQHPHIGDNISAMAEAQQRYI